MDILPYYSKIVNALENLNYEPRFIDDSTPMDYQVSDLHKLRSIIEAISDVPYIEKEIQYFENSWYYNTKQNRVGLKKEEARKFITTLEKLNSKLSMLKEMAESSNEFKNENLLYIRIPSIGSFDDLEKYSKDLKKAIEIPVNDSNTDGEVKIVSAGPGSIIFYVIVGSLAAVGYVAKICLAAMKLKKERAIVEMYTQHSKTIAIKNEMLEAFAEANKAHLKKVAEHEAQEVANGAFDPNDPEKIERLKLGIGAMSELMDKGVQVLPLNSSEEIQKSFPDYNFLSLLSPEAKQLDSA